MVQITKVIEVLIDQGRRFVKVLRMGRSDGQRPAETAPYGFDSSPINDTRAIYAKTSDKGDPVIIGYVNIQQIAQIGESRMFATNDQGELQLYLHCKNDGTMEVGGDADFMVRFSALEEAYNQLKSDHDDLVTAFNAHTHPTAAPGPPSPPTPVPMQIPVLPSTGDISGAKIDEIKTL